MAKTLKLKHQAPSGYRINDFNSIEIEGDFAYCLSHNFVYNAEVEKEKLYNGLPCYYTDTRFIDTPYNFYKNCKLHWTRHKDISLKACIRRVLKCKGIPVGTIIQFNKSWYYPAKKFSNSYLFKVKKENKLDIEFEINNPNYYKNFTSCDFSKNLTNELRANGFIVNVMSDNENFISSMISTAASYTGQSIDAENETGEIAIAYGFGKKIGYSSRNDTFMGYSNGCDNILWDNFGEFDKWSRCNEIPKVDSIDKIIECLKNKKEVNVD